MQLTVGRNQEDIKSIHTLDNTLYAYDKTLTYPEESARCSCDFIFNRCMGATQLNMCTLHPYYRSAWMICVYKQGIWNI